jgi:hypothetical protein
MRNVTRNTVNGTIISILGFLSISFITVLTQINSPIHRYERFEHKIGFPFTYYHEFMVDCPIPNSGWNITNLILDCVITWIIITGLYLIVKRNK